MQPVLYIVRHGPTGDDEAYNGPQNPELNQQGRIDAQDLAKFFQDKKVGEIYSSALKRARETGNIMARSLGKTLVINDKLDSLDVGDVKNLPTAEEADRVIRHHQQNPGKPIPGGESIINFEQRIRPEFAARIQKAQKTGIPDIIAGHHSVQYEAGKYFNHDKDTALTKPGGVVAVYPNGQGGFVAKAIYKSSNPDESGTGTDMKKHSFSHTVIEHHKDGSHTIHHIHEKHGHAHSAPTRDGDVKGVAGDHDAMMDHIMDHTSMPNTGEGNDAANQPMPGAGAPPPGAAGAPVPGA